MHEINEIVVKKNHEIDQLNEKINSMNAESDLLALEISVNTTDESKINQMKKQMVQMKEKHTIEIDSLKDINRNH